MIIVEGPDCSGKSTLIENVIKPLLVDWEVKITEGAGKSEEEMRDRVLRYSQLPDNTICDRHPVISEMIYAQACDREIFLPDDLPTIDLLGNVELVIFCLPTIEVLRETYDANHEASPTDTPEHLEKVYNNMNSIYGGYQDVMQVVNSLGMFPVVHFNMAQPSTTRWVKGFTNGLAIDRMEKLAEKCMQPYLMADKESN